MTTTLTRYRCPVRYAALRRQASAAVARRGSSPPGLGMGRLPRRA
jgi:hypothetical protein